VRARNVLLAAAIIIAGLIITAAHRGTFAGWAQAGRNLGEVVESLGSLESLTGPWSAHGRWQEVERFSREAPSAGVASVTIENPHGHITLTGGEQDQVTIEAIRYGRESAGEGALAQARKARLEATRSGDTLAIAVTGPREFWRGARMDLDIAAPAGLAASIKTASGDVRVESMGRSVEVTTASGDVAVNHAAKADVSSASGDVELANITGSVKARSVSGSLMIRDVDGRTTAEAVSGEVRARELMGPLSVSTVSGLVAIERYLGSSARVTTASGEIEASIDGPDRPLAIQEGAGGVAAVAARFSARSISGDISVIASPDSDCTVQLTTQSGDIRTNLPLRDIARRRGHMEGVVGAGRGRLEAHSVSGDISVRVRKLTQSEGARWAEPRR
jgi:hypothetical protein